MFPYWVNFLLRISFDARGYSEIIFWGEGGGGINLTPFYFFTLFYHLLKKSKATHVWIFLRFHSFLLLMPPLRKNLIKIYHLTEDFCFWPVKSPMEERGQRHCVPFSLNLNPDIRLQKAELPHSQNDEIPKNGSGFQTPCPRPRSPNVKLHTPIKPYLCLEEM